MKIEGEHILGHYHHYQLNDFSRCILLLSVVLSSALTDALTLFLSYKSFLPFLSFFLIKWKNKNVYRH